jgi:hypothetical protein
VQKPWVGWHRLRYYIPAICLIPFLACVFPVTLIYSFANINDVSWGNRPKIEGDTSALAKELAKKEANIKAEYSWYRYKVLFFWLFCTIGHITLFITYLDAEDPILGGATGYTIYVLIFQLLFMSVPTTLDIMWYYPTAFCIWAKRKASPPPEVKMSASQYVNSNLLGGDIKRKNYVEMNELEAISSESDVQDENTHDISFRNKKKTL